MIPAVRLAGIRKAFGATVALDGVDLELAPASCLALIGENGAGKSTLMKVLSGVHAPDAGTMELDGRRWAPRDPLDARRGGLAIVHQELALAPHLSVAENVLLGAQPSRWGLVRARERDRLAAAALAEVGAGDLPLGRPAGELPPAARQLVEIARALTARPRVLVLDEPTSSLGRADAERLFAVVRRLVAGGTAVVYISHFLEECRALAGGFCVLRDGRSVAAGALAGCDDATLIRHLVGRPVGELYPRVPHALGAPLLTVDGLAGAGGRPRCASFTLRSGEILGLFGLVGTGRTETLRALFGLDPLAAGTIELAGRRLRPAPDRLLAQGVALLSEDRKGEGLLLARSIADNATLGDLGACSRWGLVSPRRQQACAAALMARTAVKAAGPGQAVGELSGGNQQKVAFARLLHQRSRVLLLDEPTRGIDVGAKAVLYRLMGELAAGGAALVVVSSYIPELLGICDTIAVMERGVLGEPRPAASWDAPSLLAAAIGADHA
ncbi:MAG: sugar ABC transporter ATP-binding protein [Planctomycetes bacterium]|nr:sugar ABC transporter ATP-binding protein [Planctomycetota bacterium]